jgi:hypothetical protein
MAVILLLTTECIFYREFVWLSKIESEQLNVVLYADLYVNTMPEIFISFDPYKKYKCDDFSIKSIYGNAIFFIKNKSEIKLPLMLDTNNKFSSVYRSEPPNGKIIGCRARITPLNLDIKIDQDIIDSITYEIEAIIINKEEIKLDIKSFGKLNKFRKG